MTLAPIDATSELAVTDYLTRARDWLSTAVEMTGPEQIAAAKAEIATAAEATKQLGLSKEIQLDAQEMVRRAEYALGKAIRKGQAEGTVARREDNLRGSEVDHPDFGKPRPVTDFAPRGELYGSQRATGVLDLADATSDDFEDALTEAKAEGNLSRANVARKAREKSETEPKPAPRKPLTDAFFRRLYDVRRDVESLHRLTEDDRWTQNAEKVAAEHRNDLLRTRDLLEQVINALPTEESTT